MKHNNKRKKRNIIKKLVNKLLYLVFVIGFFIGLDLFIVDMVASLFR